MSEPPRIPFGKPWITGAEREAVLGVLAGDVLTHGPQAHAFEQEFAAFAGPGANCLTVSSGMAALHLAWWQLGIGPGDEVIVPAQTHVATVHAVEVMGATPVFVDCDRATGNMRPEAIAAAVTPRTRGIALVHFLGIPCDMPAIMQIADRHGLKVVEDCALAVGTRIGGVHVGMFGDASIFSFYPVKHITTGDGGMFMSRDAELTKKVANARAFGVDRAFSERSIPGIYDVPTLGINYRLSDINSAIGRVQLSRIGEINTRRAANFATLKRCLSGFHGLTILDCVRPDHLNSHYCLTIVLNDAIGARRDEFVQTLKAGGIGTSVYYPHPTPRLAYYRAKYGYQAALFPNAARISDQSIALPVGPHLDDTDMHVIADAVEALMRTLR